MYSNNTKTKIHLFESDIRKSDDAVTITGVDQELKDYFESSLCSSFKLSKAASCYCGGDVEIAIREDVSRGVVRVTYRPVSYTHLTLPTICSV